MPEGPSILIVREAISPVFTGKKVTGVSGNAKFEKNVLVGSRLADVQSWGKHLLLCFPEFTIRIHFLMFGSYSIDKRIKPLPRVRLALKFSKRALYFYTCSVKLLEGSPAEIYDFNSDVLNEQWDPAKARRKLKKSGDTLVCDALLDQEIFAGVGNIIKNEVLYRIRLHPETQVDKIPSRKLTELIREASNYSFDFLKWKKEFTLRKHWLAYNKKTCLRCNLPFVRKHTGVRKRRSFFCENCQVKYV